MCISPDIRTAADADDTVHLVLVCPFNNKALRPCRETANAPSCAYPAVLDFVEIALQGRNPAHVARDREGQFIIQGERLCIIIIIIIMPF